MSAMRVATVRRMSWKVHGASFLPIAASNCYLALSQLLKPTAPRPKQNTGALRSNDCTIALARLLSGTSCGRPALSALAW